MPIYEFVCEECGHEFEKILSFSAAAPACVNCGASQVERRMGRPAIHFKGSGWYITDSKKSNGKNGSEKSASVGGDSSDGEPSAKSGDADSGEKTEAATSESKKGESAKSEKSASPSADSGSSKAKAEPA